MNSLRGITSEDLYQITWVNDPAPSPGGEQLVYVSRKTNDNRDGYSSHLRLLHLKSQKDRVFTSGDKDHSPSWSPDGSQLAFYGSMREKHKSGSLPQMAEKHDKSAS